jgi:multidrug transporter EmrE-like cation transporter
LNRELKFGYIIHLCKYLGIALVSGSIVHAGTLGGSNIKYFGLIVVGIFLTVVGNYLEYEVKNIKVGAKILLLAILLSFGTGMLSGGIQHFSDNPSYSAALLALGAIVTFFSLALKDFPGALSYKSIPVAGVLGAALYLILPFVGEKVFNEVEGHEHHHGAAAEFHVD